MARKLRIQYEGAIYHVMNRGHHRENIFRDDQDRERFLKTLGEACVKTDWQIHAWCLMSNHFHLLLRIAEARELSAIVTTAGLVLGLLLWLLVAHPTSSMMLQS